MFCCTLLYVHSSIAIILMGKRELVALLISSPWPKAHGLANSIPVTPASVRPSTFSNIFSSETTEPIELKLHMETP